MAAVLSWRAGAIYCYGRLAEGVSRFNAVALGATRCDCGDIETSWESILLAALATGCFLTDVAYQKILAVTGSRRYHVPGN